jgi:hypothetical protein
MLKLSIVTISSCVGGLEMNEIAQWTAIVLMFGAVAWLFVCIYSDR